MDGRIPRGPRNVETDQFNIPQERAMQ